MCWQGDMRFTPKRVQPRENEEFVAVQCTYWIYLHNLVSPLTCPKMLCKRSVVIIKCANIRKLTNMCKMYLNGKSLIKRAEMTKMTKCLNKTILYEDDE